MTITMNDTDIGSIAELEEFLKYRAGAVRTKVRGTEAYEWIAHTLSKFRYVECSRKEKGILRAYIRSWSGYSDTQLDRLVRMKKELGLLVKKERTQPLFPRIYTPEDIALIAEVDNAESRRTGEALKKTLSDMYMIYGDIRFVRLAKISVSHLYNLRGTKVYQTSELTYTKTNPVVRAIGIRVKPQPYGRPGYLRVDSVHQGDQDGKKGVYHINLVDEVTQAEVVITVEGISQEYLHPALEYALLAFPFHILNFHSDNGSEYINRVVAELLERLLITQTKSRSRHSGDNALAEGKNGAVVRKHFGYSHIPKKYARLIQAFNEAHLNPYLFFHRQCAFPEEVVDVRGKIKKVYKVYMTVCEKLLQIPEVEQYLKEGVSKESLQAQMMEQDHLTCAKALQKAKEELFKEIRRHDTVS
jgi:transposase InsO family protein